MTDDLKLELPLIDEDTDESCAEEDTGEVASSLDERTDAGARSAA